MHCFILSAAAIGSIPYEIRSYIWDTAVTACFYNQETAALNIYWINYEGACVLYNQLSAGDSYCQQTYTSHPWVGLTLSGEMRGIYISFERDADVIFSSAAVQTLNSVVLSLTSAIICVFVMYG